MVAKKETVEAAEAAVDAVEEVVSLASAQVEEVIVDVVVPFFKTRGFILGASIVAAASVSAVVTYYVVNRKVEAKYVAISEQEIADARARYSMLRKEDYESPAAAVEQLIGEEALAVEETTTAEKLGYIPPPSSIRPKFDSNEPKPTVVQNIFTTNGTIIEPDGTVVVPTITDEHEELEWDYVHEEAKRRTEHPYIIHHDEFYHNESEYPQYSFTYFAGDNVLVDQADLPVEDVDNVIGIVHLERFGYGSQDDNIVYIRNDRLSMEFEIAYSSGKYTVEVLDIADDDSDSTDDGPRKFRIDSST